MQKNPYPGKFIVIEGLDGSGQSTQANLLRDFLVEKGKEVLLTKEPTLDSQAGKKIKRILGKKLKISPKEFQKLFAKDRKEHLEKAIIPSLKKGKIVISDRYFFSSFAYGVGPGIDLDWLIRINNQFLMPDLTFILKVSPEICIERIKKRGEERTLFEEKEKLAKVWQIYKTLPERFENIYIIDGERSIEKVFEKIKEIIYSKPNLQEIKLVKIDGVPEVIESFKIAETKISIISPAFKIEDQINGKKIVKALERYGRVCYKSEGKITLKSVDHFLKNTIKRGHFSIIEHEKVTVRVICDRGVTHEWVRHRIASYSQESTRYCNYEKLGFQYIYPSFFKFNSVEYREWKEAIKNATLHYLNLLRFGCSPQEARGVLPNSLKTEIIITHNMREWRHFFYLRCSVGAHPQIREIAIFLLKEFQKRIPFLFDDFEINEEKMIATTDIIT